MEPYFSGTILWQGPYDEQKLWRMFLWQDLLWRRIAPWNDILRATLTLLHMYFCQCHLSSSQTVELMHWKEGDVTRWAHRVKHWGLVEMIHFLQGGFNRNVDFVLPWLLQYFRQYYLLNNHLQKDFHKEWCTTVKTHIWDTIGGAAPGLGRVTISISKARASVCT